MTGSQRRLYSGMLQLFREYHTGAASWAGVHTSGGTPSTDATETSLPAMALYAMQNNRVKEAMALPQVLLFTAPWMLLPIGGATVNLTVGDVLSDGTYAFLVQGIDTSQGFQLILAAPTQVPAGVIPPTGQAGYRSPLWIFGLGVA